PNPQPGSSAIALGSTAGSPPVVGSGGTQTPFPTVQATGTPSRVCPASHDSGPVQPCATYSMWLVWKFTPKVGGTPLVADQVGQPGCGVVVVVVQLGLT